MVAKSLMQIDVDAGSLQAAHNLVQKYSSQVDKMPGQWSKVGKAMQPALTGFDRIAQSIERQTAMMSKLLSQEERSAKAWSTIAERTKNVASHIHSTTMNLLKWGGIALLGAGGLFGLDWLERLPGSVGAGRRSALGLGVGYGQLQSFGINLSRYVNPEQILGASRDARYDITSPSYVGLRAAGINPAGNAAELSAAVLRRLPQILGNTPEGLYGPTLRARGLDQFVSLEDAVRFMGAKPDERARQLGHFEDDARQLNISKEITLKWQDLSTQISRAGQGIENVFVTKMAGLAGPLEKLSGSIANAATTLLGSIDEGTIKRFGERVEEFAKWLVSDDLKGALHDVVDDVRAVGSILKVFGDDASAVASVLKYLGSFLPGGGGPAPNANTEHPFLSFLDPNLPGIWDKTKGAVSSLFSAHNPGAMRRPGASTGFASFPSDAAGLQGIAKQLSIYGSRDKIDTIAGIISKYAPSSENNTGAYISDVAKTTGFDSGAHLNLSDKETMAKLVSAITKHEGLKYFTPQQTRVLLENQTGSSVITSVTQTSGGVQ